MILDIKYFDSYMQFCQRNRRLDIKTIKAYKIDIEQFTTFIQAQGIELDRRAIEAYVRELSLTHKPASVKRKYASIKAYFNFLEYAGYIEGNPFLGVRLKVQDEQKLPRIFPFDFLRKMLSVAHQCIELSGASTIRILLLFS